MRALRAFFVRLGSLFVKNSRERDFARELESNLALHTEENLRSGLSLRDARRAALLKFGGISQATESYRERRGLPMLETLLQDFRYGIRTLLKNPGFTAVAILTLALGIGANAAIFTVIKAVLLEPLPYPHPERLVDLYERDVIGTNPFNIVSGANFLDWQHDARSFEQIAVYGEWSSALSPNDGGVPEVVDGAICSHELFSALKVQPAMGRTFTAEEDQHGAGRVAVISDSLWKRRFGARSDVLGTTVRLDGEPHTVIGVMPPGFGFPGRSVHIWLPVWQMVSENDRQSRGNHRFMAIARLRPGVTIDQARSELDGIAARIKAEHPTELTGRGANVVRMDEHMVSGVRPMLLLMLGVVASVLLIACVNVTNLLLERAISRKREVAVRVSLGASRSRILRQFLVESSILSLFGAALGLAVAVFGVRVLIHMAGYIPRIDDVRVDGIVLAFTTAIALLTGIAVGVAPAMSSWRAGLSTAMQEGTRLTPGKSRALFRDALVAVEVALSLMLLIGAGLMLKSFWKLHVIDPGFATDRVVAIRFSLPYKQQPPQIVNTFRDLLDRVRATPGVESAGIVSVAPLAGHFMDTTFTVDGRPPLPKGQFLDAVFRAADPRYFKAMGIPLKRGRVFTEADLLDAADKAIITEGMAQQFFPNEDPIGKRLRLDPKHAFEIVGIVGNTRQNLARDPEPTMYFPLYGGDFNWGTLMIRATGDPNLVSLPVQKIMRAVIPALPPVSVTTTEEMMAGATQSNRFALTLITLFAGLALVLASIGLYGVLAYSVRQRTGEMGIRIALGADAPAITKLVLWQGMKPAAVGIAAGLLGGLASTRLIQSLLFQVKPNDPIVIAAVALVLALIAMAASFAPAWRATRIDPVIALRTE
ncbi:MAG TPA: ABC transporter permease [Candidatus Acidoferrales bacterium]|nr:ABC transporter permease [Candidatus Acidoferrales bacterium]